MGIVLHLEQNILIQPTVPYVFPQHNRSVVSVTLFLPHLFDHSRFDSKHGDGRTDYRCGSLLSSSTPPVCSSFWSYVLVLRTWYKSSYTADTSAKEFTRAASILGIFVVGGLIANYGGTSLRIVVGDPTFRTSDRVLSEIDSVAITLGIYVLIKKADTG